MDKLASALPLMFKTCAVGVVLVIIGRVSGIYPIATIGGLLMVPLSVVAALACLAVVLLAPAYPFAAIAEKIPAKLTWPFIVLSCAAMLAWWALWGFIATGALADH